MDKGVCTINTFVEFKQEIRKYFTLNNAEKEEWAHICLLKEMCSIHNYIKEFTTLMLEITNMSDKNSLFYFQDVLKDWVKAELDQRGVQYLNDTIVVVESVADYST